MPKNHWIHVALAFAVAAFLAAAEHQRYRYFLKSEAVETSGLAQNLAYAMHHAELNAYDFRFKARGPLPPHPDVAIIKIDEKSLAELHQWPWPRSIHARLIETLAKAPPTALLFDVFFVEPFTQDRAGDADLIRVTRRHPWVVHSMFYEPPEGPIGRLGLPFNDLLEVADAVGYANAVIDDDGMLRRAVLQRTAEGQRLNILSLIGASFYLHKTPEDVVANVPRDERGRSLIHYAGKEGSYPYYSYADVLSGQVPASTFTGKIVLIGSTAAGTFDHYPTPFSKFMPGVEFHANVIDNLIRNQMLRPVGIWFTYAAILLFGLLVGLFVARFSPLAGAAWTIVLAGAYLAVTQWAFTHRLWVFDAAGPMLTLLGGYLLVVTYRFFTEEREKRMVRAFFSQQVSGELLEALMANPEILTRKEDRREMTVFFSDVAGFTSISEKLQPGELVDLLNEYLTAMTEVIFKHGGYVDKYMGDGIMAFWNGVLPQPDHAERACRCALDSKTRLAALNESFKARNLNPLGARIGVNTGIMAAGYMGSAQKKQFTVMGDNVNLGSRLEGANKAFGSAIMLSEFTYELVKDRFEVRFLDKIRVPGKSKPVKTYELLAVKGALEGGWHAALPLYQQAIDLFVDRQFAAARQKFLEVKEFLPQDKACAAYIERADAFMQTPPEKEWDGVYELHTK